MKDNKAITLIALTSSLLFPQQSWANNEEDPFFDMPVVLSASRLEQPISQTPVSISSIDRQTIEASGARTIPEILRLVPGIIIGYSANEYGDEPKQVVTYHGHTDQFSKQMQVLIDGRSIYEPILGGVAWNMLPINIDDIERIEVSRGPNAPSYGTNSFLAVINIITRHAGEDPGMLLKTNIGNHNIRDITYRHGGKQGDVDYRITMTRQSDDGLDARFHKSSNPQQEVDNYDDRSARSVDYRIDYQINNNNQLTYQGGYSDTRLQINENFSTLGIKPVRDSNTIILNHFLKFENIKDSNNSFVLQYYYNQNKKSDLSTSKLFDPALLFPGAPFDTFTLPVDFGLNAKRHNIEFTHFNKTNDELRFVWGVSAQQDIAESPFWLGVDSNNKNITIRRERYTAFSNVEWHASDNNIINFGALLERDKTTGYDLSPRLSLIHQVNTNHSVRAGVSRAIRSPFLAEEYGSAEYSHPLTIGGAPPPPFLPDELTVQLLVPAERLENENIISREIAYFGRFLNNDLNLNFRLFRDTLSKLIDAVHIDGDSGPKIHKNLNSTTSSGLESTLR